MPKALGVFIFGGSATLGVEAAGFEVEQVLEMTDNMPDLNAHHFVHNRPDVPLVLPQTWETPGYLGHLKTHDYDLLYSNCPCSSLSRINRFAAVDGPQNVHFYRVFQVIGEVQPKAFFVENAPTLIKMGYPILMRMLRRLGNRYRFTVIRDYASNHGVAMKRMRTLLVGWRRDLFDPHIPLLHAAAQPPLNIRDLIGDLYEQPLGSIPNHVLDPTREWAAYDDLLGRVAPGETLLRTVIRDWPTLEPRFREDPLTYRAVTRAMHKLNRGQEIWDKSPLRREEHDSAPSMTSITQLVHPWQDRQWTVREYARIMGYPDDFIFHLETCQVPPVQAIAQGVPVQFARYIANEVAQVLAGNRQLPSYPTEQRLVFQHNAFKAYRAYSLEELYLLDELDYNANDACFNTLPS